MSYTSGASSGTVAAGGNGYGASVTQLENPFRAYFDSYSSGLIIADTLNHNIVLWPINGANWTLLAGDLNGHSGSNSTMLNRPYDVTLDPMGNMYVADRDNHRIQLFMKGETEGITIAGVSGVSGSSASTLTYPRSVKLDNQLNLYVADSNNNRIQKFMRY